MMKLITSPVGDDTCMAHVQSQLVMLRIQLSEITKEKEKREHVWCITCKIEGHRKEVCPTFAQYMATGESNLLEEGVGYCEICKTWGHHLTTFLLLQKYQSTPKQLFYNFCKSVGHDEKDCRTFNLMRESTLDAYKIQE
jgi:hypothetical protein